MLNLSPEPETCDVLDLPGAFAWWYVDAVTPAGDGLVLIWSWGLPFLPGYGRDARGGRPVAARARPSINLCVYERGEPAFYLLYELPPDAASVTSGPDGWRWRFGDTEIHSVREGHTRRLRATIDLPVPAERARLRGTLELTGAAPDVPRIAAPTPCEHHWTPLAVPATVDGSLRLGDTARWNIAGRGYHDMNRSAAPLHTLGIADWAWGRIARPGRDDIHYLLWPDDPAAKPVSLCLSARDDGSVTVFDADAVRPTELRRNRYGVSYHARFGLPAQGATARVERLVDEGPFYLRYLLRDPDSGACGWGERVRPAAIDTDWMRPLVKMRVHRPGEDSAWLPLFSGPREGRVRRLLRHWWEG